METPTPLCPKCANDSFMLVPFTNLTNSKFRHSAIICSQCHSVVGTEEEQSMTYMAHRIGEALGIDWDH